MFHRLELLYEESYELRREFIMKTKEEMMQMLFARLTELQNLIKKGFTTETVV